jgi:hypothetical protein
MFGAFSFLPLLVGLDLRPYVPPALEPEPQASPSSVKVVEVMPASGDWDANVFARPVYTAPLVGNVARGARVRVRGELELTYAPYCNTGIYYALEPFGWLCADDAEPSDAEATSESVLTLVPGTNVPYQYVMVTVPEGEYLPMWGSEAQLFAHAEPERQLGRGDTLAIDPNRKPTTLEFEGASYHLTADGKVVPVQGTYTLKDYSQFQGAVLNESTHFPFGWVTPKKAAVYDAPLGQKLAELSRRTRVDVEEEITQGKTRWLRVTTPGNSATGEPAVAGYVKANHVNEVRKIERPEGTGVHAQWIDVDLGEQVVVAYSEAQPVYATLTSSGRPPNSTPRGNYPVWGKATAVTMKSQEYDDTPYYVNRVPWAMFFQAHNALHAAYWHDRFGTVKSHGCANLSPADARTLFDWLEPELPPGWTSVRYWDLTQAPVVHVRNSQKLKPFAQERNVGPPDKNDEAERLGAAVNRRTFKEREEAIQMGKPVIVAPLTQPTTVRPLGSAQGPLLPPAPLQ